MARCIICGSEMPPGREEVFETCVLHTSQAKKVGVVEGVSKYGNVVIVEPGTEDARRAFSQGNCVIRRTVPKKYQK